MILAGLFRFLLVALLGCAPVVALAAGDELLEPEKAFGMSTRAVDESTVEVSFAIADGYYMYRDRFKFALEGLGAGGFKLGAPDFPAGIRKKDEFFGEVETYRRQVTIRLPVERNGATGDTLKLSVTSQGCADAGVCYVPMQTGATVKLAAGGGPSITQGPDSVQPKPGFEFGVAISAHRNSARQTPNFDHGAIARFPQGLDFVDGNKVAAMHAHEIGVVETFLRFGD